MALALDGLSPTIAVGFRKLLTAYAGNCILAEKTGTTQNIGFSGNDIDEAAITTFGGASGVWVDTYYDQSGNARDTAEGGDPGFIRLASANLTFGGKVGSNFGSGAGTGIIATRATAFSTLFSAANATALCCVQLIANDSNDATIYGNAGAWTDAGSNLGVHFKNNAGAYSANAYNWDGSADFASASISLDTVLAIAYRHTGGNIEINVNNGGWVQAASGNTADLSANLQIGKDVGTFDARFGELALFNTALTDEQILAWQVEAAGYRGLDLNPATDDRTDLARSITRSITTSMIDRPRFLRRGK
jgi:hypothetical protein